nr:hypothetical protein Iba_chr14fCG14090 [Ipomoea batatas]
MLLPISFLHAVPGRIIIMFHFDLHAKITPGLLMPWILSLELNTTYIDPIEAIKQWQ